MKHPTKHSPFKVQLRSLSGELQDYSTQVVPRVGQLTGEECKAGSKKPVPTLYYGGEDEAQYWEIPQQDRGQTDLLKAFGPVLAKYQQCLSSRKQKRLHIPTPFHTHTPMPMPMPMPMQRPTRFTSHATTRSWSIPLEVKTILLTMTMVFGVGMVLITQAQIGLIPSATMVMQQSRVQQSTLVQVTPTPMPAPAPATIQQGMVLRVQTGRDSVTGVVDKSYCFVTFEEQPTQSYLLHSLMCQILVPGTNVRYIAHSIGANVSQIDMINLTTAQEKK